MLPKEITFEVVDGIIETLCYHLPPRAEERQQIERYQNALAPIIGWAREHRPWEAHELFARGKVLDYSGDKILDLRRRARRQMLLLEDYRNAVELAALTRAQLHSLKWRREPDGSGTGTVSARYPDSETGEMVSDNRRIGFRSLEELPSVLSEIIREDGRSKGEWRTRPDRRF